MTTNEDLLFAELAVKRELVTQEQVDEILAVQRELTAMGLDERVADLMVKKGFLVKSDAEALRVKVSPRGGRQQIEGYRLVERIGRGGMGAVYKAIQLSMGRPVAIKVLKPSLARDDQRTQRLRREAQLVGKLTHPNIVRGLDSGVSHGFHYFAMEYVEGASVREILEERGPMKEEEALRIVGEVARALDHAHGEGVVHRDIKPGNILIDRDGSVKLTDYGLAKGPLEDVELTHSGVTVGTPQYISPEQARGPSEVDIRTDLYSLGATLYHMVTGRPPYEGETLAHLIQQVLYEPYAPPRSLRRDLSPDTAFLIDKMMARRPRHRYQSPRELLHDLEAIEKGQSIVPAGWEGDFEAYHLRRRYRRLLAATLLVFVVAATASGFLVWHLNRLRREETEKKARETFEALEGVPVSPEGIPERIDRLARITRDFDGTEGARRARERMTRLRAEQEHLQRMRRAEKDLRERIRERGEYGEALRALSELGKEFRGKDAAYARGVLPGRIEQLRAERDRYVRVRYARRLDEWRRERPEDALAKARAWRDDILGRAYMSDEPPRELAPANRLVENLDTAIRGVSGYLDPIRKRLDDPSSKKDFRQIANSLTNAFERFKEDRQLTRALGALEPGWREELKARLPALSDRIVTVNRAVVDASLADVRRLEEEGRFSEADELLQDLGGRSLDDFESTISTVQEENEAALEAAKTGAEAAWAEFLPAFLDAVEKRRWEDAETEARVVEEKVNTYRPNPYVALVQGARESLGIVQGIEGEFLKQIDGQLHLAEGLKFGSIRYEPVSNVEVAEGKIRFDYGGRRYERAVGDVSVESLVRYCGLDTSQPLLRFGKALLRFGELRRLPDVRNAVQSLEAEDVLLDLGAARDAGLAGPFSEQVLTRVRADVDALKRQLEEFERHAEDIYLRASRALSEERWKDAYDGLSDLLGDENLKKTRYVEKRRELIESQRKQAEERLPSLKLGNYYHGKIEHLAGVNVRKREYRVAISFDLDDPRELERFSYTPGRIGIVAVKKLRFDVPVPGETGGPRTVLEHELSFFPPEKIPEDLLAAHPLRFACPFVPFEEIDLSFRVRWEEPLALLLSLCGTNVVVLTDDGRRENGRGVHIWQSAGLTRPDLAVPDEHRKVWIDAHPEALRGEAGRRKYFQFVGGRWYRVRFVKREKSAALYVDGRLVREGAIEQYRPKGKEIVVLTWTPCVMDEIRIEGTLDPEWYARNVSRSRSK